MGVSQSGKSRESTRDVTRGYQLVPECSGLPTHGQVSGHCPNTLWMKSHIESTRGSSTTSQVGHNSWEGSAVSCPIHPQEATIASVLGQSSSDGVRHPHQ